MRKLSVVIPSLNEKDNIVKLVDRIDGALEGIDHEIIFADDSDDDTPLIVKRISREKPHVKLIHRNRKMGLAIAVAQGFKMADGDYLACMDADLQHPPEMLFPMYVAMESGAEYCLSSRFIKGGSDGGQSVFRKLISAAARKFGKLVLKPLRPVSDPTGGFFMVKKQVIVHSHMKPAGWKILTEALSTSHYNRIIEIPYTFAKRNAGNTKINLKVSLQYLIQCMSLKRRCTDNKNVIVKRWTKEKTCRMMKRYREERMPRSC